MADLYPFLEWGGPLPATRSGYKRKTFVNNHPVDLKIRTRDFALRIIRMFGALPKSTVTAILGRQVLRSGTSIGANYREAFRARSKAEFIAKCGDSLKELEETSYWLELLVEGNIVPAPSLASLRRECDELTAIFVTIINKSRAGTDPSVQPPRRS
jgi:four helix bundle protein